MTLRYLYLGSASNTIGCKFALSNQKNYPDLGSDASSVWNFSALVSQTSFRGETSGGIANCRLFSQAARRRHGKCTRVPKTVPSPIGQIDTTATQLHS